jgi:hypothetical protein
MDSIEELVHAIGTRVNDVKNNSVADVENMPMALTGAANAKLGVCSVLAF